MGGTTEPDGLSITERTTNVIDGDFKRPFAATVPAPWVIFYAHHSSIARRVKGQNVYRSRRC
jgi:hypothetical protein